MDDFALYPLSLTPHLLTMLFSFRSGCEKSRPVKNVFRTGQHHGIAFVPSAAHPPTWA